MSVLRLRSDEMIGIVDQLVNIVAYKLAIGTSVRTVCESWWAAVSTKWV